MSSWVSGCIKNLLPLSEEKRDFQKALREWFYTGDCYDFIDSSEKCELCEYSHLRYQFKILNKFTKNKLLVGSECINRFEILAVDEKGFFLSKEKSRQKLQCDRQNLIKEAKKKKIIDTLVDLSRKDKDFNINSFIDYIQDRNSFTPNQLSLLFWRLDKYKINYTASDFKLSIRRNKEKEQLLTMEDWKVKRLWKSMSTNQREWYYSNVN